MLSPSLILLDRDGVLNVEGEGGWVTSPEAWVWMPGALDGLRRLGAGRRLMVVTNQSCVGRGLVSRAQVDALHAWVIAEARREGVVLEQIFVCPHAPDDGCACRKPAAGNLTAALARAGVPPNEALFVGDSATDAAAAAAACVRFVLVRTGKGRATEAELEGVWAVDDLGVLAASLDLGHL